jgi:TPR repeat protein
MRWFQQGANQGDAAAMNNIGSLYYNGLEPVRKITTSVARLRLEAIFP